MARDGVGGLVVLADNNTYVNRVRLNDLCLERRMLSVWGGRDFLTGGGVASYQSDYPAIFRRAAVLVDVILKGRKPAEIPFEQATKLELVVDRRAAKALGITVPQALDALRGRSHRIGRGSIAATAGSSKLRGFARLARQMRPRTAAPAQERRGGAETTCVETRSTSRGHAACPPNRRHARRRRPVSTAARPRRRPPSAARCAGSATCSAGRCACSRVEAPPATASAEDADDRGNSTCRS